MVEQKLVSVIMGIYNCADTLSQAIDSILDQTYTNWELIMCDDCSTDSTFQIALEYAEKYPEKIKVIQNDKNSKLAFTLNHCLQYAKGFYVARMDGDDYCSPDRLEKQVKFLETHSDYQLIGTFMQRFNNQGLSDIMKVIDFPGYFSLRQDPPFFHATIMTYKSIYDQLNGYTVLPRTIRGQDYDLWFRFFHAGYKGANLQEILYFVREDENAVRRRTPKSRWYILQTRLIGYRLLKYPKWWFLSAILTTVFKMMIPYCLFDVYRKIQAAKKKI